MSPLFEICHRIAKTKPGTAMLEFERDCLFQDAYGSLYMSVYQGEPLVTVRYPVRDE